MALASGTRLGPYEILGALGAGGMGEVYKARDTRLDRTVAIKVMSSLGQADPDSRARFEREARVLASFDHPHICALHDVGREGDVDFIVMPFVTGETLATRLSKGPLPLPQVIEVAVQIADALDRAHAHNIIHRDLKPANVMLTKSGARLLDFGLARLEAPSEIASQEAMATRSVLTKAGTVMGTVPYMSPEQLNGRTVDARTDIWAFGCLLYEMIGGRAPFGGGSDAEVIGAILRSEPEPLSKVRPEVPAVFDEIISIALAKDPEERWQHMRDVKRALALAGRVGIGTSTATEQGKSAPRFVVPALAVLTVALAALAWFGWSRTQPAALVRFDLNAVRAGAISNFTDVRPFFASSPDGRRIAYTARVDGTSDIWIKAVDEEKAERLADTGSATSPFWSPDGQSIAFYAGGKLKRKSLSGGPAQELCEADSQGINGTWNAAGVVLFSEWGTRRILQVPESGGRPVEIRKDPTNPLAWVHFLPDGRHFLFTDYDLKVDTRQVYVGSLDSAENIPVAGVMGRAEYANGHLIFWREGTVFGQPFDLKTFQVSGQPIPLAEGVHAFLATGFAAFSVTPALFTYQSGPIDHRLVWIDRQGLVVGTVSQPRQYVDLRLSPDEKAMAFAARDPKLGTSDVFVHEFDRDLTRQLTSDRGTENGPLWTPDGKTIVFAADRHGPPNLHARNADGTGVEREVVPPAMGPQAGGSITPDGKSIVFLQPNPGTDYDVMTKSLVGREAPRPLTDFKGRESSVRVSPDGRWIAFNSAMSGRSEIYVQALSDGHGRRQVSREGGFFPRWDGSGKQLYFIAGPGRDHVMAAPLTVAGDVLEPGAPNLLFVAHDEATAYDVTKDGKRFLMIAPDRVAERGTLSAVMNWTGLLSKQVPK
jgi:eukaryotic-like serine/threonine-protein kinase